MSEPTQIEMLEAVLGPARRRDLDPDARPEVNLALWLCLCCTQGDEPNLVIFDQVEDGRVAWSRVADDSDDEEVAGRREAQVHTEAAEVLGWLRGDRPGLAGADTEDAQLVLDGLRPKILASGPLRTDGPDTWRSYGSPDGPG